MVDPYLENLRSASDFTHNNWMNQQRREQTAREINTQRNRQNFIYQASAGLRPPEFTAANIPAPQPMPNAVAPPVDPASVQAAPAAAAAPNAGLKTSRQGYEATQGTPVRPASNRAENMPLPPAIPLEQMTPAQRAAYARYAETAIRSNQAPGGPNPRGDRPIERLLPGSGSGRNVHFNDALRLGAVSIDNTDISGSPYDTPSVPVSQMNPTQRAAYAHYVTLVNRGANPQAIALARQDAEATGVFAKTDRQDYAAVPASQPQTPQSRTNPITPLETAQPTQGGTLDTRNPQDLARIAQAIGLPHSSAHRTPERNAQVGGVPNSRHLYGNAIDFPIPEGWTIEQANQHVQQQWQQSGFPPAEFIASDHGTGPHVHVEWGGQGQAPTGAPQTQFAGATPTAPRAQQIFQAVSRSPEGLPFTVRTAQNEYDNAAAIFQAAQANGMLEEAMAAATTMRQANVTAMTALGFQAALDIIQSGNPARFQQYYQAMTGSGSQIAFQPFQDGTFSYSVDGVEQGRGTREEIASDIMSLVNTEYLQQQQEAANERNQAQFESGLRMREDAFSQQLEGQRDLTQAAFEAELERRNINPQSVRVVEIDAEGTRGVIYQTPEGRIVLRAIRQSEARGPSTDGRGDTTIIHGVGPEIDVTDQLNG